MARRPRIVEPFAPEEINSIQEWFDRQIPGGFYLSAQVRKELFPDHAAGYFGERLKLEFGEAGQRRLARVTHFPPVVPGPNHERYRYDG